MVANVKVERNTNENNLNLLRRFTKRVQGSGVLRKVRSHRYYVKVISPNVRKKKTLQNLTYKGKINELIKLGKITPKQHGTR
ncbi:MAG: 30S ribosomal protein S21 [Patescibacteria group bacterium]